LIVQEPRHLRRSAQVLAAVLIAEAQVLAQSTAHRLAIKHHHRGALIEELSLHVVRFTRLAASGSSGRTVLWSGESGSNFSSLIQRRIEHFGLETNLSEEVVKVRFDEYALARSTGPVDWMKLDVEGHELAVLEGMGDGVASVGVIQF
jgi:FkbM family methyltransferase